ncbi:MAG: hypothetical protein ACJAQT_002126 [Akkermansiaceae bacterium]
MVGDDTVDVFEGVGFFVECFELFAVGGLADVEGARDFGGIESVEGLAEFVEDVVGDIDDVVDGAEADRFELFDEPVGAGGDFDSFDGKGGVERADEGIEDDDGGVFGRASGVSFRDRLGLGVEQGGELAGEAGMGKEVGAVRGDFDFNEGVGVEEVAYGSAYFEVRIEDEEAVLFIGEADFGARGEHAFGFDAAHFGFANFESAGEMGSGEAAGDFVADLVVGGSADDLAEGALARVDLGDFEAVGVGVLNGFFDLGDDNLVALDTHFLEAFDFDPGEGEEVADFIEGAGAEIEAFFEPVERDVHVAGRRRWDGVFFNRKARK